MLKQKIRQVCWSGLERDQPADTQRAVGHCPSVDVGGQLQIARCVVTLSSEESQKQSLDHYPGTRPALLSSASAAVEHTHF